MWSSTSADSASSFAVTVQHLHGDAVNDADMMENDSFLFNGSRISYEPASADETREEVKKDAVTSSQKTQHHLFPTSDNPKYATTAPTASASLTTAPANPMTALWPAVAPQRREVESDPRPYKCHPAFMPPRSRPPPIVEAVVFLLLRHPQSAAAEKLIKQKPSFFGNDCKEDLQNKATKKRLPQRMARLHGPIRRTKRVKIPLWFLRRRWKKDSPMTSITMTRRKTETWWWWSFSVHEDVLPKQKANRENDDKHLRSRFNGAAATTADILNISK